MKYAVYGTGECAAEIYNKLYPEIDHVIDDNPTNKYIPLSVPIKNNMSKDVMVLMGIFNQYTDPEPIKKKLRKYGYKVILDYIAVHILLQLPDRYWLSNDHECISEHLNVLKDTCVNRKNKYFPNELPMKEPLSFIDCGAYDGDTIRDIIASKRKIRGIIAFEPCTENYNKLSKLVQENANRKWGIIAMPCALSSKNKELSFTAAIDHGKLSSDGERKVYAYKLDYIMNLHDILKPNYIKMDIEGSELDALKGAKKTIAKYLPRLAIALYHRPNDLVDIPKLIKSWKLPYDYHIRSHGYNGLELFLYCVPKPHYTYDAELGEEAITND